MKIFCHYVFCHFLSLLILKALKGKSSSIWCCSISSFSSFHPFFVLYTLGILHYLIFKFADPFCSSRLLFNLSIVLFNSIIVFVYSVTSFSYFFILSLFWNSCFIHELFCWAQEDSLWPLFWTLSLKSQISILLSFSEVLFCSFVWYTLLFSLIYLTLCVDLYA